MSFGKGVKRKRATDEAGGGVSDHRPTKEVKRGNLQGPDAVQHALLAQFYPKIQTLRTYVLAKLPASSRIRRKKIASLGLPSAFAVVGPTDTELCLCHLLDSTLVGSGEATETKQPNDRWEKWISYSQKGDESYVTVSDGAGEASGRQCEIVDFVIWLIFERAKGRGAWPKHLLSDGFRRSVGQETHRRTSGTSNFVPGLYEVHLNSHRRALKEPPWPQLLALLGKAGEKIMIDLLADCSIFTSIDAGRGNYHQLSGVPIFDVKPVSQSLAEPRSVESGAQLVSRTYTEIVFARNRMLYARAALNARGLVRFGLRHIHVLNRYPHTSSLETTGRTGDVETDCQPKIRGQNTTRVLMYMFPRQFGLHNVFTSTIDRMTTAQKFQDYTLREEEIVQKFKKPHQNGDLGVSIPKRLRGSAKRLVEQLQVLHGRCSYSELLRYYCPIEQPSHDTKQTQLVATKSVATSAKVHSKHSKSRRKSKPATDELCPVQFSTLDELATPIARVSAFCQAAFKKILPDEFWGAGETQLQNKQAFLRNIDRFIRLRRFESMNLHDLMQGLKITDIDWLIPPRLKGQKTSQSDVKKRTEIFAEFLYYLIDSLLIPLIRSNFYVTESNVHRYRLLFFRHDVWRYVAEPAMTALKAKMFEEVKLEDALRVLDSRQLGFSQVRLLPKGSTVRPIINLRRRTLARGNQKVLGPSINSVLGPVHAMLKFEKIIEPQRLGSAMFSVGDMYTRLRPFKQRVRPTGSTFYFAKVDVQAAFDTIPQAAIIRLMQGTPSHSKYNMLKHVEIQANSHAASGGAITSKSTRRWHTSARPSDDADGFHRLIEDQYAPNKKNTVFVDSVLQKSQSTRSLLALMGSHIQQNLVKIGKKYYRQKEGIPQGSVLSSSLCNYFYADLERRHLSFLQSEDCLLLRLIDDFLLITTDKSKATQFVTTMHGGFPDYGVQVNPNKSLVNFDLELGGSAVARTHPGQGFPYCGTFLDCQTLDISKDHGHARDPVISNSLTVEYSRHPGQNFRRKVLNAFKIHSHVMFFDSSHNSPQTTLRNVHAAFVETASKMWAYARCLPAAKQPRQGLVIDTIKELIEMAFHLLTSKSRSSKYPGYKCGLNKSQVAWLALHALQRVLVKKQSGYKEVLAWIREETQMLSTREDLRMVKSVFS